MDRQHNQRCGVLRWRGFMADADQTVRRVVITIFALLSATMVATQLNYTVVGDAHMINVLAPIAGTALLFGPFSAVVVGAIAGAVECVHAMLIPLDVYEQYFASPFSSIVLFALIGLVMGVMYALASRRTYDKQWKGVVALVVACAIGAVTFTALFSIFANLVNSLLQYEIPSSLSDEFTSARKQVSQILANCGLMSMVVLAVAVLWKKREDTAEERTLRQQFQGWLFAVVCAAYLVCASATYTVVTMVCRASAEREMQAQIDYLAGQLTERDRIFDAVEQRTHASASSLRDLRADSVSGVAQGLALGERGISAVGVDGMVVSASDESLVGQQFEDVVGAGMAEGFDDSIYNENRSRVWYMSGTDLAYVRAAELSYVRVSKEGSYQLMAAIPQAEVYQWRGVIVGVVSTIFLALFAVVYAQASILLKNVVVRGIDETNEALGRIAEGDLNQEVKVADTVEFSRLSAGINATVGSLKNAIAAEAARNDRDLATAKAIQESALPRVFPPFPDIEEFDIYASMNAAREVGGDFYDLFLIDETHLGFLIADVSGKGIPASLFMMAAKTEIANNMQVGMDLSIAIQTANWHLCQGNDAGMFVTVWAATLNFRTGELTYVNAGHNPPLLRHDGQWVWLKKKCGLFLGTFDTAKYRTESLQLTQGDQLFLYTDGVNEAFNINEEEYGNERLEAFLSDHANKHPRELTKALRDELHVWAEGAEQSDDITMMSLEYGVPPEATNTITLPALIDNIGQAIDMVNDELSNRHCPITVLSQVDIALEELLANVCRYAYAKEGEPGNMRVDYVYNANPHTIVVSITDWGVPFDPIEYVDPIAPRTNDEMSIGGLGILMAKKSTDDMSYVRDEGENANVVAFRKSW